MAWFACLSLGMLLSEAARQDLELTSAGGKAIGEECSDSLQCAETLACIAEAQFAYTPHGNVMSPTEVRYARHVHGASNSRVRIENVPVELTPSSISQGTPGKKGVELMDPLGIGGIFQECPGTPLKRPCLGTCNIKNSNPPPGYYREELSMLWKVHKWAVCHPKTGVPCEAGVVCQQLGGPSMTVDADYFCLPIDFNSKWESSSDIGCTGSGSLKPNAMSWSGTCKHLRSKFDLRCYRSPQADQENKDDGKCFIPRKKKCDPQSETFLCRPGTKCSTQTETCVDYEE